MTLELITGLLILMLAVVTTTLALAGMAGMLGLVRFPRCSDCGRLGIVTAANPEPGCVHCGHERLLHPLVVWRHAHGTHHPRP